MLVGSFTNLAQEVIGFFPESSPQESASRKILVLGLSSWEDLRILKSPGNELDVVMLQPTLSMDVSHEDLNNPAIRVGRQATDFLQHENYYDLVMIDRYLNILPNKSWKKMLRRIQKCTRPDGWNAVLADSDDLVPRPMDPATTYLHGPTEISSFYHGWYVPTRYGNTHLFSLDIDAARTPGIQSLCAQKKQPETRWSPGQWRTPVNLPLLVISVILSMTLCSWGYLSLESFSLMTLWPGSIFQALWGITLGGWGVLAAVISGILTDVIRLDRPGINPFFVCADIVQTGFPALYFRSLLTRHGWTFKHLTFARFALGAIIIPRLMGSFFGAYGLKQLTSGSYGTFLSDWMLASAPLGILAGWPIYRVMMPHFIREGWALKGWWA